MHTQFTQKSIINIQFRKTSRNILSVVSISNHLYYSSNPVSEIFADDPKRSANISKHEHRNEGYMDISNVLSIHLRIIRKPPLIMKIPISSPLVLVDSIIEFDKCIPESKHISVDEEGKKRTRVRTFS